MSKNLYEDVRMFLVEDLESLWGVVAWLAIASEGDVTVWLQARLSRHCAIYQISGRKLDKINQEKGLPSM